MAAVELLLDLGRLCTLACKFPKNQLAPSRPQNPRIADVGCQLTRAGRTDQDHADLLGCRALAAELLGLEVLDAVLKAIELGLEALNFVLD